ncbi:MAG: hypothetical protein BGP10_09210 [Rhodanobacter sp. 68-29]|nr:MAG: hypothetical protein ABT17_11005 [Rhodanobacter sp. SCN 69-32]OJY59082.1 MAG: hypothetical protein BGP10_09210 [Rhodanobacter sp. 68-29]
MIRNAISAAGGWHATCHACGMDIARRRLFDQGAPGPGMVSQLMLSEAARAWREGFRGASGAIA